MNRLSLVMRSLALALFVTAATCCQVASAAPLQPLSHAGRWITDASGRVVVTHGINMVYKLPPYYPAVAGFGEDDAAFLSSIGFNAVRVGVIWKAVEPQPGHYDDAYLARIAGTVNTLARHGIFSLLDLHQDMYNERFQGEGAPDWAVQDDGLPALPQLGFPNNYLLMPALQHAFDHFWQNSPGPGGIGLQDRFAAAWRHVAQRFRSTRGLLGYELINEPFPGTLYAICATSSGCPGFDGTLTAFNRRVNRAIRTADSHAGLLRAKRLVQFRLPHERRRTAGPAGRFAFHDYCLTNEAAGCSSQATDFANALQHVKQTGEAAMLTEFGATNSVPDLESMLSLADRNMIPWLEWAYCGCEDPTTSGPGTVQAIVIDPRKPPTGSNLVSSTLRALVEPYPQVIAGTPSAWHFDRASGTFGLAYSTVRTGGTRRFGPGSVTEISTPALVHGRHYAAQVAGGAILSAPGASLLRIASCPGAKAVSVRVTPSGPRLSSCRPPTHGRKHRHGVRMR